MPYQRLLDALVRRVSGAHAALLLDSEGEVVVESGTRDERNRLIGAYQGIALGTARRTAMRYQGGAIQYMLCRYDWGHVILRPLKDGYYLVLSLGSGALVSAALHHSEGASLHLDQEL
jgi:predicted regulator of Ras-like GTPase activity (Roadblock/LC7/MglB family)